MVEKNKTLVILAFDQTKTPKKKLKKLQKEILSYLSDQNFKDFFLLKENKQGLFLRFLDDEKKHYFQTDEIHKQSYNNFLYIDCSREFFCGDYNYFCKQSKSSVNVALSFQGRKSLSGKSPVDLPFGTEKILHFSKESLKGFTQAKKNPQLLLGTRLPFEDSKSLQSLKCMRELRAPCLFLDRDGVIIKDKKYLSNPDEIEFVDGIFDLVAWAKSENWYVIVVTNQSGIGRGLYTEEDYLRCQDFIEERFRKENIPLTRSYFSPYHESATDKKILGEVYTRKPFPGMLMKAARDFPIDFERSFMIGDKKSDEFIETPLKTLFLKGDYPIEESSRSYESLKEILAHLQNQKLTLDVLPVKENLTSHPLV